MPVWIALNDGNWNNDPSADPATNVGGQSLVGVQGDLMYPFAIASNSTQLFNFGASSFSYDVPSGFTAGWPAHASGYTSFDETTLVGGTLSNGNLTFSGGSQYGGCLALDGYIEGSFYFEMENVFNDFFTTGAGTGISRAYDSGALDYDYIDSGEYNDSDIHGGVVFTGGSISSSPGFDGSMWNQGTEFVSSAGALSNTSILRVAVILEPVGYGYNFEMSNLTVTQPTATNGDDSVSLRWSDDMGANWGDPLTQTLGATGVYETNIQFRRLGYGRYRVWELSWSGELATAITNIFLETQTAGT
jgi:hypothetical protein